MAFDIDVSDSTTLEFGLQYQSSDSIQVPGWTRVTQDLVDNGTVITGAPPVRNRNGGVDLRPNESGSSLLLRLHQSITHSQVLELFAFPLLASTELHIMARNLLVWVAIVPRGSLL